MAHSLAIITDAAHMLSESLFSFVYKHIYTYACIHVFLLFTFSFSDWRLR